MTPWYSKSYRRNLVDMHIDDWNPEFLQRLDADRYADLLATARVRSAMLYANSHVGLNYWPSSVGRAHRALRSRDHFGAVSQACRARGMDVVAYYSVIFNNWAYEEKPAWRMVTVDGTPSRELRDGILLGGRYGLVCPNNEEYRQFEQTQVTELAEQYDIDGFFFDMNFWPVVCYCDSCTRRFKEESGEAIPTTIDWSSPTWRSFVKRRSAWLVDHAEFLGTAARARRSDLTIQHNFAALPGNWSSGFPEEMTTVATFTSGDFYGGPSEKDFICKLLRSLSPDQPFEFMTSRCHPILFDHTSTKSTGQLRQENALALAHGGAFLIIDAIDPDGSLDESFYTTMSEVFRETEPLERHVGGKALADVCVYLSLNSLIDLGANGTRAITRDITTRTNRHHLDSAVAAARVLRDRHVPYAVTTKRGLASLADYRVLVLSDVEELDDEESDALRAFVAGGGALYISSPRTVPLAAELLGFNYVGPTDQTATYMIPCDGDRHALSVFQSQVRVRNLPDDLHIVAELAVPFTDPEDPTRFASIHSNPPGSITEYPAVVLRQCGAGRVAWAAAPFEAVAPEYERHGDLFAQVIQGLVDAPPLVQIDAPPCVEVLMHASADGSDRFYLNFVNLQEARSSVPVRGIRAGAYVATADVESVTVLPDGASLTHTLADGYVRFDVPELDMLLMVAIDVREGPATSDTTPWPGSPATSAPQARTP